MTQTSTEDLYSSAYSVANALLMIETRITDDVLDRVIVTVTAMSNFTQLDPVRLKRLIEANVNVHVGGYSVIDDKEYKAWIDAAREARPFAFWERYRNFLEKRKRIPRDVIGELDGLTDDILDRLRDPATSGQWDRRGLVVGDVQSGKTSNYIGLVCKAVDAGFPLVIVLAGVHNSLRSQTQLRVDEGFLGFDTRLNLVYGRENQRTGAGTLPGAPFLVAHSLTSSGETGDFRLNIARGTKIVPGGKDPVVLVVKKQVSILTNLITWVLSVRGEQNQDVPGTRIIPDVPLLLIDDEADYASANTNEYRREDGSINEENDPTKTNSLIRQLLTAFEKSCYVGYTATPFANVFMHHEANSTQVNQELGTMVGQDLFPRSFIVNIPAPSNYIGAEKVFGLKRPGENGESAGIPIVRPITDAEEIFPPRHKKELIVSGLPDSLIRAVLSFILVCAARRARGDIHVHNSMLVHVTRFTMVQEQVADLLEEELRDVRRQLEFEGTGGTAMTQLRTLWDEDFSANAQALADAFPNEDLPPVDWPDVRPHLFDAAKRITVRKVNGSAKDALDYADHPHGLSVIAVGGDKLSRGLTLEGLSMSYFVRTSRMYDTLMQMGRWFGYRPRYADLCRLYTSPVLTKWYRDIATATAELKDEFDYTVAMGGDPLQFGNRVRTHPDGLLITAANKMRAGAKVRAGFSGTISETVAFDIASAKENFASFDRFFRGLGDPSDEPFGRLIWKDVKGPAMVALLKELKTTRDSWKANSQALAQYVQERVDHGQLTDWTVVLLTEGQSGERGNIAGQKIKLIRRDNRSASEAGRFTIGRLVSPTDEMADLSKNQHEAALSSTFLAWEGKKEPRGEEPKLPSGPFIRQQRARKNGLLLVYPINGAPVSEFPLMGFAVSFPFDPEASLVEYAENSVKQLEEVFD